MEYDIQRELVSIKSNVVQIQMLLGRESLTAANKMSLENLAKATEDKLLQLERHLKEQANTHVQESRREALTVQTKDLQNQLNRFQALQTQIKATMQKENQRLERKLMIIQDDSHEEAPLLQNDQGLRATENEEELEGLIGLNNYIIQERHAGMQQVSGTMYEVSEIFRDLGMMVSEQGEALSQVNQSIETSANRTRGAREELGQVNERRKRRSWTLDKFVMALILGLLMLWTVKDLLVL
jgi:t-SNARE complex subunit (syntaxin)